MLLVEQTVALLPLTVATVVTGEQTTVATTATVAAVAGDGTRVTADERDGDQSEEHRDSKTEETLHHRPPNRTGRGERPTSRHGWKPDPGRLPDRSKTLENQRSQTQTPSGPAALPCKRCGSVKV
jgi:hypothetical protein